MEKAFDLFEGLASLSSGNKSWFDNLSEDGKKAASPYVMMCWMSGTSDQLQIIKLNTLVNMRIFSGSASKSELFKMLAIAATGSTKRYNWIKGPSSRPKKLSLEVVKQYYDCSGREAASYNIDQEDLIEMADELGWDKDEMSKLKKELDDGFSSAKTTGSKTTKSRRGRA